MKNLITFLTLVLLLFRAEAQDNAIVNFVATKVHKDVDVSIYLNDINVGIIGKSENLQVKMQSTGRISIVFLAGQKRIRKSIDVESGGEYYFEVNYWVSRFEQFVDNTRGKEAFESNKKTITFVEDIRNPIGKIDKSAFESRPKQGSGFLINDEGFILTNFHVIDGAKKIEVTGIKGDFTVPFTARLIASDRLNDLALIKIDSKLITFEVPPYDVANSKNVTKAERIFALGYPMENAMGREVKVTDGIINSLSGFKQSISEFQISAAVQGGNSGGPLFNVKGQVIGIVSAKISSEVADQVGYAIKSNYINFFLNESGITHFSESEGLLESKSLSEQVHLISKFIYIIKAE